MDSLCFPFLPLAPHIASPCAYVAFPEGREKRQPAEENPYGSWLPIPGQQFCVSKWLLLCLYERHSPCFVMQTLLMLTASHSLLLGTQKAVSQLPFRVSRALWLWWLMKSEQKWRGIRRLRRSSAICDYWVSLLFYPSDWGRESCAEWSCLNPGTVGVCESPHGRTHPLES